ncbi:MAG: TetR/AcrR family transcriptional regulator [Acidimicrobiales bacterium]|nr:TetR/AcrR family transcriptional regulator [Acidimicrobiales bacterium]
MTNAPPLLERSTAGLDDRVEDPTSAKILAAAYAQLLDFGLRRTTVEDVARRAGVARITVYRRFGGRDELLATLLREEAAKVFAEVDAAVATVDGLEQQLTEGFAVLLRSARSHPLLQRLLTTDADSMIPMLTTGGAFVIALGREYLTSHLDRAVREGRLAIADVRSAAEVAVRLTMSFLLTPESVIPLGSDEDARRFARRHILPSLNLGGER